METFTPLYDTYYNLYFGPAHCGSGNFGVKLRVRGEKIIDARADPGYLHRGFEKLMEYRVPIQNAVLSDRLCVLEPLSWNLVHAEAVEEIMGIEIPERASYIRVIMAELTRIQSHLIWFAAFSMGTGFDAGFKLAIGYRDYILDIFERITGARVYPAGYICPGGVRRDIPENISRKILDTLDYREEEMIELFHDLLYNPIIIERTRGVGVLKLKDAVRLGATGPVLRACGLKADVRKDDPYEVYGEFDFEIPTGRKGDALSRLKVGVEEMKESVNIIKQALEKMPQGDYIHPNLKRINLWKKMPPGEAYARIEAARGEACCYMVSDGHPQPYRVKFRGPSFLHMIPVLEFLLKGAEVADVPAIHWSLNPCPADLDR